MSALDATACPRAGWRGERRQSSIRDVTRPRGDLTQSDNPKRCHPRTRQLETLQRRCRTIRHQPETLQIIGPQSGKYYSSTRNVTASDHAPTRNVTRTRECSTETLPVGAPTRRACDQFLPAPSPQGGGSRKGLMGNVARGGFNPKRYTGARAPTRNVASGAPTRNVTRTRANSKRYTNSRQPETLHAPRDLTESWGTES